MFGVMFGDIAHGGLLLIFGLFLIFKEESLKVIKKEKFLQNKFFRIN
jgi:vacuolar-type H+-ATPase subunit I/STV1